MDTCGTGLGGLLQTQKHTLTLQESTPHAPDIPSRPVSKTLQERSLLARVLRRTLICGETSSQLHCAVRALYPGRAGPGRAALACTAHECRFLPGGLSVGPPAPRIVPLPWWVLGEYRGKNTDSPDREQVVRQNKELEEGREVNLCICSPGRRLLKLGK